MDVQAQSRGMTRAGFINYAISRALDDLQLFAVQKVNICTVIYLLSVV